MPIKIPNQLPATETLTRENIFVMTETRALTQDIRPLRILLLNLMPTKVDTETQFARVLGNTPLQIELELIAPSGRVAKNTPQEHMLAFYKRFCDVKDQKFDGLLITGAPVEHLPLSRWTTGRAVRNHGMEQDARSFDFAHLLGRAGRVVLSLRHSQASAAPQAVWGVRAYGGGPQLHPVPRL